MGFVKPAFELAVLCDTFFRPFFLVFSLPSIWFHFLALSDVFFSFIHIFFFFDGSTRHDKVNHSCCSHRTRVVSPLIDVLDDNTFEYIPAGDMTYGGFDWKIR